MTQPTKKSFTKVTFFACLDVPFQYFNTLPRYPQKDYAFEIMREEGLFAMKAYTPHQRVRSRDIYNLKIFLQHGKSLDDLLVAGSRADPSCSTEYAKSVLVGEVPLDSEDEGFDLVGVRESMTTVYAF